MKERCEEWKKKLTFTAAFVWLEKTNTKPIFFFFFKKKYAFPKVLIFFGINLFNF